MFCVATGVVEGKTNVDQPWQSERQWDPALSLFATLCGCLSSTMPLCSRPVGLGESSVACEGVRLTSYVSDAHHVM